MADSYKNSDKPDSGALFPNKNKETETQPHMTGQLNVGGTMYWISAWKNTAQSSGVEYMKLAVTKKEEQSTGGGKAF
tara:strand:- start:10559 stop:10789 length:231 start_codon:yes stop_codon:yes gene_type:complete